MNKAEDILLDREYFFLLIIAFILMTLLRISYMVYLNNDLVQVLSRFNFHPMMLSIILSILNILFIIVYANIIYFTISIFNSKFQEINEFESSSKLIKRICYFTSIFPMTLNSLSLLIYMFVCNNTIVSLKINTIITSVLTSFLLFICLKKILKANKISTIVSLLFLVMNTVTVFF